VVVSRIFFTDTTTLFFALQSMATQLSEPNNDLRGAEVFSNPDLSRRAKVMYGIMLKYADVNGKFTISHDMLLKEAGVFAKKNIALATKELVEKGIIKRRRTREAVRYTLLK
jgi:hypothetical protein